jgi:hypothetical protein
MRSSVLLAVLAALLSACTSHVGAPGKGASPEGQDSQDVEALVDVLVTVDA